MLLGDMEVTKYADSAIKTLKLGSAEQGYFRDLSPCNYNGEINKTKLQLGRSPKVNYIKHLYGPHSTKS